MKVVFCFSIILVLAGCAPLIPDIEIVESQETLSRDLEGRLHHKDRLFSGYLVEYYPDGTLKTRSAYSGGLLESVSYGYYPTGEVMYARLYVKGEKHGTHAGYYPDGSLKFRYHFVAGKSVGNHQEWYENGLLAKDLNYVNGQPFGSQKMWRPDGKIRSNYVIREDGRRYGLVGVKRCKNIDTELEQITRLTSAIYDK
ncbi:hypothetical protein RT717_01800 [Imperialibacter roseus]|uniref:MORN repeat variant n=1 Tax=Imperialibacter roseus TaxID=1324217 RepID=A0ABZ0IQS4_9BACT|nr:hypothetical protein [Imperialibacter roseus]WOK07354.1 hypothetical protein RT717_01800 [Imperialibacter roseus]